MKPIAKISLLAALLAAPIHGQAPVQKLPQTGDMYEMLDLSDPYRTTISGLFVQPVDYNGGQQQIHVYVGAGNRQSEPFVLLLLDADEKAAAFFEASGWRAIAEEQRLIVAAVQPPGDD